jgi:hypothetical protein
MPHNPALANGGKIENRKLRMQQALQLRAEGATYRDVAGQLGISETTARELIHDAIAEVNATNHRLAEDMIYEVTARLEMALGAISPKVIAGDVYAIEKWVMLNRELVRLYGLAKPVAKEDKLEVTVKGLPAGPGTVGERIAGILAKQAERQLEAPGQGSIIDLTAGATTVDATSVREIPPGQDH